MSIELELKPFRKNNYKMNFKRQHLTFTGMLLLILLLSEVLK